MARLYEEVFTRLEEMAMITTRALKWNARMEYAVRFNPATEPEQESAVEIVSSTALSGAYDYRAGACFEMRKLRLEEV